jgi:hypothetical protein
VEGDKRVKNKFKTYPIGYFHIDIAEVQTAEGKSVVFRRQSMTSGLPLPAQPVDATQALNLSAGVSNCKVSRGRSFRP